MALRRPGEFPPKKHPQRESIQNLHVITSYFNPCRYRRLRDNYWRFRENLNAPLHTIELLFGDREPDIPDAFHVRSNTVLWHKEALLNILIDRLPPEVDAIAWVDADLLFTNPYWVEHACQRLEDYAVIQLFAKSFHKMPDGSLIPAKPSCAKLFAEECKLWSNFSLAHPGFAWAARASWLRQHKLADTHVIGGGDTLMVSAFTGRRLLLQNRMSPAHREWHMKWVDAVHQEVCRSLNYIPGHVHHLWHGFRSDRNYVDRFQVLSNFDPARDLIRDENGLWAWSDQADPAMVQAVSQHFQNRAEDKEWVSGQSC